MEKRKIAVIGLGYVGLPLAAAFSKKFPTIGYDIDQEKVDAIKSGIRSQRNPSKNECR